MSKEKLSKNAKKTNKAQSVIQKNVSKSKKAKAGKPGKTDEVELEDSFIGDEEVGAEEIPDLSEFEDSTEPDIEDPAAVLLATNSKDEVRPASDDEVVLTDAEGRRLCRVRDCDQAASVEAYCRYHYLQNWKRIQVRRKILADGKLERYVDELTARYPDKFLEMIRKDLRSEKDFLMSIAELEIDESGLDNEFEDESQNFIDEVRGVSTDTGIADEEEF